MVIEINGNEYIYLNIVIQQYFAWHHHFEVRLAATVVGNKDKVATLSDVQNLIGEEAKIQIEQEEGSLLFTGVITEVDITRSLGQAHDIVLSGYSPTIKIEDGRHCRTFEEMKVGAIVKEILGDFPDVSTEISPEHDTQLEYCTQYKETNYNFISRLADLYGEWFYYDGQKLHYGVYGKGDEFTLKLGKTTGEYHVSLKLSPANFDFLAYDYPSNEVFKTSSKDANVNGLDQYGDTALKTSEKFFPKKTTIPTIQKAANQKELDDWMEYRKSAFATDMVRLSGDSNNPSIHIGTTIKLLENDDTEIGKYLVTHVTHSADGKGSYRNHFEAVPASIKIPPPNNRIERPLAETQVAVIKDNADPDGLGRVRVQFHWQENNDMTPWIRVAYPYAGSGDLYAVPEVEDEVMVGFEFDNPNRPYVIGSLYHGQNKPTYFSDDNSIKAIRTKDGNRIILIDGEEGEIQILNKDDKNSVTLSLKEDGLITIKTEGTLKMEAKIIEMKAEEFTAEIEKTTTLKSGQDTKVEGQNISMEAQQAVSMKGMEAKVEGQTSAEVKGTQAKLEGDATATIKGGMVMIN